MQTIATSEALLAKMGTRKPYGVSRFAIDVRHGGTSSARAEWKAARRLAKALLDYTAKADTAALPGLQELVDSLCAPTSKEQSQAARALLTAELSHR